MSTEVNVQVADKREEEALSVFTISLAGKEVKYMNEFEVKLKEKIQEAALKASNPQVRLSAGPVRLPVRIMRVTVRKGTSGQGTASFDRYQMRIHKWHYEISATTEIIKDVVRAMPQTHLRLNVTKS